MPLIKETAQQFPEWSEVREYHILRLEAWERYSAEPHYPKSALFVVEGTISMESPGSQRQLSQGDTVRISGESGMAFTTNEKSVTVLTVHGIWSDQCGDAGVFTLDQAEQPGNTGDPVPYPRRNTDFDNHFHECDECWFIIQGSGEVVTEGNRYRVEQGDCVLTKHGDHHDFPLVFETVCGVYFETTLRGKKRLGHLYDQ